jgi:DNA-binding response OmpR family regulator
LFERRHLAWHRLIQPEEETADLLRASLKQRGYRVTVARTPHDALVLVEQIRFDLVFLDESDYDNLQ